MLPLTATASLMLIELEQEIQALQGNKAAVIVSQDESLTHSPGSAPVSHSTERRNQIKHHVHFPQDFEEFYPTLHKSDYTFVEKLKTWIDLDDLDQIQKERRSTIKRMSKGSKLKKSQDRRGLEAYTRERSRIRKKIISDSIAAVKKEQSNQITEKGAITVQIAKTYGTHSLPCQLAAYERGLSDQVAAHATDDVKHTCEEHEAVSSDAAVGWQRS